MASEAELLALAERVEAASGAARSLDEAVAAAVQDHGEARTGKCPALQIKPFTASLDAAMTLVPEGRWWSVNGGNRADVWASGYIDERWHATAITPALALTAACLRARAATMGGSDD